MRDATSIPWLTAAAISGLEARFERGGEPVSCKDSCRAALRLASMFGEAVREAPAHVRQCLWQEHFQGELQEAFANPPDGGRCCVADKR